MHMITQIKQKNFYRKGQLIANARHEEESSLHILAHCPAFELPRIMTFNNEELDLTKITKIDLESHKIIGYFLTIVLKPMQNLYQLVRVIFIFKW